MPQFPHSSKQAVSKALFLLIMEQRAVVKRGKRPALKFGCVLQSLGMLDRTRDFSGLPVYLASGNTSDVCPVLRCSTNERAFRKCLPHPV